MFVIGTAGHVDHGKSTLVKALTGIDPDRWEEEQRRRMTIDLGFAWLTLADGRQISLVDVPGHERFIKNMLAGVGGMHAVLLVIAADESLMPQTREHLAILDLLQIRDGIVVITKADLVDADWLALVQQEIREVLAETALVDAPQIVVSARTGDGLPQLRTALAALIDRLPHTVQSAATPRLSIDRSFTIGGFGTVVTGTLVDGALQVGQEVVILPSERRARVRGLQSHQLAVDTVEPGRRVAVNLSGIHHRDIQRGDLLTLPDRFTPTRMVDVELRLPADGPLLQQNDALDLFVGAAEVRCRVTLLDQDELVPGSQGWAQLRLDAPLTLVSGDRLILRVPSPSRTAAGGRVIDPHPARHRRFRAEVIDTLRMRARGEPRDLLLAAVPPLLPISWSDLLNAAAIPAGVGLTARTALQAEGLMTALDPDSTDPIMLRSAAAAELCSSAEKAVSSYHQRWPLRRGMPREELRRRLKLPAAAFGALLRYLHGTLTADELTVHLNTFTPEPDSAGQRIVTTYLREAARTPFAAPTPAVDVELLNWMIDQRLVVRLADDAFLLPHDYEAGLAWVRTILQDGGTVTVAAVRDRFATSRRYALALLEHLDELRITRRVGDLRVSGDAR